MQTVIIFFSHMYNCHIFFEEDKTTVITNSRKFAEQMLRWLIRAKTIDYEVIFKPKAISFVIRHGYNTTHPIIAEIVKAHFKKIRKEA